MVPPRVKFGNVDARSFTVDSETQITAVVGDGATGKITVSTPEGTARSEGDFTYSPVTPSVYWVDITNGDDENNSGREETPWKTLHHAVAQINGGPVGDYTLILIPGTYSIEAGEADNDLTINQTIAIYRYESRGEVILDGSGASNWTTGFHIDASNVVVDGLEFMNFTGVLQAGISINSGSGNTVARCTFHDNNKGIIIRSESRDNEIGSNNQIYHNEKSGITILGSSGNEIHHNQNGIYDNGTSQLPGIGISIEGGSNNQIHHNNIFWSGGSIRQAMGISALLGTGNEIYRNIIYNHQGEAGKGVWTENSCVTIHENQLYDNHIAIHFRTLENDDALPTIQNNVLYSKTAGLMSYGLFLNLYGKGSPLIYHNTIDQAKTAGIYISANVPDLTPAIKYNIISNGGIDGIVIAGSEACTPAIDYNDVWKNAGSNYVGCTAGNHDMHEDPLYGSYALQSDSPCIDAIGLSVGDPVKLDYPGNERPQGNGYDMGAYEYVGERSVAYTLPGGTGVSADYRIFTVPLHMTGAEMLSEMEDVLDEYNPGLWRVFAYISSEYLEIDSSDFADLDIKPGMGFWLITLLTDTVVFKGDVAPDGINYEMALSSGWHLIANPWVGKDVTLGDIQVTDGVSSHVITSSSNELTLQYVWDFTGEGPYNGYEKRDTGTDILRHNVGYFLKVLSSGGVTLVIPPVQAAAASELSMDFPPRAVKVESKNDLPPPPPGMPPVLDIKANGLDGPVEVQTDNSVALTVALSPGSWQGFTADWWVAARTPFDAPYDWYTYVYPHGWQPGISPCKQSPLFEIKIPFEVLNQELPPGNYTFYFAVDGNDDGKPDATWLDSVPVIVK